jgi:hypothetical protein
MVELHRYRALEGFLLCEECGLLVSFPEGISLN